MCVFFFCGVNTSVYEGCYSTHHRVMSQARDDFEGFLKAHMSEEEKVIVHVETSLPVHSTSRPYLCFTLAHSLTRSLTHSLNLLSLSQQSN